MGSGNSLWKKTDSTVTLKSWTEVLHPRGPSVPIASFSLKHRGSFGFSAGRGNGFKVFNLAEVKSGGKEELGFPSVKQLSHPGQEVTTSPSQCPGDAQRANSCCGKGCPLTLQAEALLLDGTPGPGPFLYTLWAN